VESVQILEKSLTRERLYEEVWRTPMRSLAHRVGCSDRGLSKLCDRHRIPVPPRGYWAKLAVGKRMRRPALAALSEAELKELGTIYLPIPQPRKPAPESIAAEVAEETKSSAEQIRVRSDLRGAHALVAKTRCQRRLKMS
jgi:hypothetical protein